jgi:hypothetical protein
LALAASTAGAQAELPPCPPAEQAAVRSYVPTAAKLKAFTDATAAAVAAAEQDPALAAVLGKGKETFQCRVDDNETRMSFAGAQAMMTKYPRLGGIYAAQGISARDLVIWGDLAVLFAFASQPQFAAAAAGELSPAQQAFVRDNKAGIERLMKVLAAGMKKGP